jgi:hypothetical protein
MSSERKDFLSRWSRRKIEVRQALAQVPAPVADPTPVTGSPPDEAEVTATQDGALTPEEIAALPDIEQLTPDTDITVFLRKGVPDLLRNAALRRMWSLDPAIRDYVSEAREYAYDWNVPGGVPGNGPLLPSDNVEEMLGRIFGDGPKVPENLQAPVGEEPADAPALVSETEKMSHRSDSAPEQRDIDDAAHHEHQLPHPGSAELDLGAEGSHPTDGAPLEQAADAALPFSVAPEGPGAVRPRRHGGAKPV